MLSDDTKTDLNGCYRKSENVVGRFIMDEYILVPLARSTVDLDSIFRLNPVGAFIWEHFDGHTPGNEIIKRLVAEFDVSENQAIQDFQIFVAQLESIQAVYHSSYST
jgi:hypothetical protein